MLANWELAGAKLQVHKNYVMDQVTVNLSWHYWNQSDANFSFATVNSMHYEIISCVVFSLGYEVEKEKYFLFYIFYDFYTFYPRKTFSSGHQSHYFLNLSSRMFFYQRQKKFSISHFRLDRLNSTWLHSHVKTTDTYACVGLFWCTIMPYLCSQFYADIKFDIRFDTIFDIYQTLE